MPRPHDLGKRREFSQRVEVGVLLHVFVVGVADLDRLAEQVDGSFGQCSALRLVLAGNSLRRQGIGTGGIVVQSGIPWLFLERRFQRLQRFVGSITQFRRHDDCQVEFLALAAGVSFLELLQIHPRLVFVA